MSELLKDVGGWMLKLITAPLAIPAGVVIALMDIPVTKKGFWWNFKKIMKDTK